jgi:hypothetical protein
MTTKRVRFGDDDVECGKNSTSQDAPAPAIRVEIERLEHDQGEKAEVVDTPEKLRLFKEKHRLMYARYFRNEQAYEDFCMLPLNMKQRETFALLYAKKELLPVRVVCSDQ